MPWRASLNMPIESPDGLLPEPANRVGFGVSRGVYSSGLGFRRNLRHSLGSCDCIPAVPHQE